MNRRRGRFVLGLMIVLFALPSLLAWWGYHGVGWRGDGAAAAGRLVSPAQRLPTRHLVPTDDSGRARSSAEVFSTRWTLLQVAENGCATICRERLTATRQLQAVLHDNADRVQRILVLGDNGARADAAGLQPGVAVYRTALSGWRARFAAAGADTPATVYLIDPAGRWMAFYPASQGIDALHHDITRLLRIARSH